MNDLKLSWKQVEEKEFPIQVRGYDVEEVDKFFTQVVSDYQVFNKRTYSLEATCKEQLEAIRKYEDELATVRRQLRELQVENDQLRKAGYDKSLDVRWKNETENSVRNLESKFDQLMNKINEGLFNQPEEDD